MAAEKVEEQQAAEKVEEQQEDEVQSEKEEAKDDVAKEKEAGDEEDAKEESKAEDVTHVDEGDEEHDKESEAPSKPAEPEKPKEQEEDAPEDSRPKIAPGSATVSMCDASINVMPSCGGKLLMTLSEGGFQYLLATARSTVGMKSGRYFFEVKIVDSRMPSDGRSGGKGGGRGYQDAIPRQLLRLGFSCGGSSLFIGDGEESIGFDSEGQIVSAKGSGYVTKAFLAHEVFGVLLNLDADSPNANTISLFRDGLRVSEPKPIPEAMRGKVLFPTVNYRNVTLSVSFGPTPMAPLPFDCRMIQDAAKADVELTVDRKLEQGQLVVPVCLPDQGSFDWLDDFLKRHPDFVEISDRAILAWAEKSGLRRPKGYHAKACNDRPGMDFDIREMDDLSVRRLIDSVAPVLRRNFVVMEVKGNLTAGDRQKLLEQFNRSDYNRTAMVVMGEPTGDFKKGVRGAALEEKKARAVRAATAEFERKRREKPKPKANEDDKKVVKDDEKEDAENDGHEDGQNAKDGEKGEEAQNPEEPEETLEDVVAKAGNVELTEDEQEQWYHKHPVQDLKAKDLSQLFAGFTIPERSDGFDEIKFEWQDAAGSADHLQKWILQNKLTQRVEDLKPGAWFQEQLREWQRLIQSWRKAQSEHKDTARKGGRPSHDQASDAKRARKEDEGDDKVDKENQDTENVNEDDKDDAENTADAGDAGLKPDEAAGSVADEDPFLVGDVCDVGAGKPLFADFVFEDWEMLKLRFELHALAHGFRRDMDDAERPSFHESHLTFYYNTYFRSQLVPSKFSVKSIAELLDLVPDTVLLPRKEVAVLQTQLSEDAPLDLFVRLTESDRRRRQMRQDLGEESAQLKIQRPPPAGKGGDRGGYQQRDAQSGGGYGTNSGGYSSRTPPSRGPAPAPYSSGGARGGHSGGQGGYNSNAGSGGYRAGGGGYPAPPPQNYDPRGYGGGSSGRPAHVPSQAGNSYGGGAQKRPSYPSSSGQPPYKTQRSAAPTSGASSRSYGGGGGGGSYRR